MPEHKTHAPPAGERSPAILHALPARPRRTVPRVADLSPRDRVVLSLLLRPDARSGA